MTTETSEHTPHVEYTTFDEASWNETIWEDGYYTGYDKGEAAGTKWAGIGFPIVAFLAYIIGYWAGSWVR